MNMQFKWDVYLITSFYTRPNLWIGSVRKNFCEKHGITYEDLDKLKRANVSSYCLKIETYGFIARYIPLLYNRLDQSSLEDVFDIAAELSNSGVCISEASEGAVLYRKEAVNPSNKRRCKRENQKNKIRQVYKERSKRSCWEVCR